MMVGEYYEGALMDGQDSLILVIEFLVFEKKVLQMEDTGDRLSYFLQDRFKNKMNEQLKAYKNGRKTIMQEG
jgi:hypothetical protein